MNENILTHHGIQGMRWGDRNGPPYPLQPGDHSLSEKRAGWRKSLNTSSKSGSASNHKKYVVNISKAEKKLENARKGKDKTKIKYAKEDLKNERIKEKINAESSKSNNRIKLENKYKSKGMSPKEAAIAAYENEKTRKIVAATLGIAIVAVGAYAAYSHHKYKTDTILKSGVILQRVESAATANQGVRDGFYASYNKIDNLTYRGVYGKKLQTFEKRKNISKKDLDVFIKNVKVDDSLNVASDKSQLNGLKEMVKNDPEFMKELKNNIREHKPNDVIHKIHKRRALRAIGKGKINDNVYKYTNYSFVDARPGNSAERIRNKFYDHMRSKGYDAIRDANDSRMDAYKTSRPIIVINSAKTHAESVKKMTKAAVNADNMASLGVITIKNAIPMAATGGALYGASKVANKIAKSKRSDKIVRDYRKEHPNTKLTYTQIVRNYSKKKK